MRPDPAQTTVPPAPPEVIEVHEHRIWCDGGGGALGHPRVFMEIGGAGFVECGYCDRRFVLGGSVHAEDEQAAPGAYEGSAGR
jgi:uncharacterized Zn-finger protein